ncbi:hypothetical protein [Corynebacterium aurimucosum]|uniref:Uncharacterized protein n=1 Tax=Corynebacterium aurimucosum (strain ATCC 700975 / DSM 44827 / CIP 107346 / CN-1) TaxID=548476 RepID=C3PIB4_CORA7|nr:hypothetical protein [Corynebacterium aurimucosum]ACP33568.1 hypothetical protein cauri_1975 [Corynebacterium aurimucosum ATCC 700975]QQU92319.1 hypothetical protein I6I67_08720 [Corynebacterium aurimucosum]
MVVKHTPRHEVIDARVWDVSMSQWWSLAPWEEINLQWREDWGVDTGEIRLAEDHPRASRLRAARHVPVPVTFEVNGVRWDGYVESTETGQEADGTRYLRVTVQSETKHFHRMLGRGPVASAADGSSDVEEGPLGEVTHKLIARGAVRTGLPTYVLIDHAGDPVQVEVRTEDYVAGLLEEPLAGSDSFVQVRKLLPGEAIPGVGTALHYEGPMERDWAKAQLGKGVWPMASINPRVYGAAVPLDVPPMPDNSWAGRGQVGDGALLAEPMDGICWVPFETVVERPVGYYAEVDPAGVHVISRDRISVAPGAQAGRPHFVTHWAAGTFKETPALKASISDGLVRTTQGEAIGSVAEALGKIGKGEAYAWKDGAGWVLATPEEFRADNKRYAPTEYGQPQTPGVLVWQHAGRDRRGVVFSSAPGGGLKRWATTETAPDGAMLIGGGQLDAQTIAALESGVLKPQGTVTSAEGDKAKALLPSSATMPGAVERLDVDVQPHATIDGTDVSFSRAGGRVNIEAAGPFFLREKYMSLSSTGGTNPTADIAREWAASQGTTSMSLTPGHHQSVVFGDDMRRPDGRVVPGWKPGDRISFVDGNTRVSEVIMGYTLKASSTEELTVEPILGRRDNGIMSRFKSLVSDSERSSRKALLAPARKVPKQAVQDIVDKSTGELTRSFEASYRAYSASLMELGDTWRQELKNGLSAEQQARVEALRNEQQARERAGTDLRGQLEAKLNSASAQLSGQIASERQSRQSGISAEAEARKNALSSEEAARKAAIAAEAQARALGDSNEARARQKAISDLSTSFTTELETYGRLVKEAKEYVDPATAAVVAFWSEENQNNFNKAVQLTLAAQSAYNDVNNIKWVSQDAWNEQQQKINDAAAKFQAQQLEINDQNEAFRKLTEELDAQQTEQIVQLIAVQKQIADESRGRIREIMATPAGTSDPRIPVEKRNDGEPGWQITLTDMVGGSVFNVQWHASTGTAPSGATEIKQTYSIVRTLDSNLSSYNLTSTPNHAFVFARWASVSKRQVTVDKSADSSAIPRRTWQSIMTYPAPTKVARQATLRLKVTWAASTYDDMYGIRIRAGDRTLRQYMMTKLGPLTFLGNGEKWMSTTVSNQVLQPGETISAEVYTSALTDGARRMKSAELTGTWIEEV